MVGLLQIRTRLIKCEGGIIPSLTRFKKDSPELKFIEIYRFSKNPVKSVYKNVESDNLQKL